MKKSFVIDTCALMEQENTVEILRNGSDNEINIPITVINELDGLAKTKGKRQKALKVVKNLLKNKENINFIGNIDELTNNDDVILGDAKFKTDSILVTNDLVLQLKSHIRGVKCEGFKKSNPWFEDEKYTGIIKYPDSGLVENCFFFKEGKLHQYRNNIEFCLNYNNTAWNISAKDVYQNAALEMLKNKDIYVKTIQSNAGTGKTYLSLAAGLFQVFEKKLFKKLVIIKYPVEVGEDLGFLPGKIEEKMEPHWKPIYNLLLKLNEKRRITRGFIDCNDTMPEINPRFIDFMPVNYLRGDNIDNAFVIITEAQNIPRDEMRTILSRMGENCNVVCEGDISQIDNKLCNKNNNGLNWLIKLFKDHRNYAHLEMNCKSTRGPICDMVKEKGL